MATKSIPCTTNTSVWDGRPEAKTRFWPAAACVLARADCDMHVPISLSALLEQMNDIHDDAKTAGEVAPGEPARRRDIDRDF